MDEFICTGWRRLEVCSIGIRSFIFMDICHCLCRWHMSNYSPSAIFIRYNKSNRYSIFKDCKEETWIIENGKQWFLAYAWVRCWRLEYVPKLASDPGQSRWPLNDDNNIYSKMNHYYIIDDEHDDDDLVSCYLVNTTTIIINTTKAKTTKPTLFRVGR